MAVTPDKDDLWIRQVWAYNLDEEIAVIRSIVNDYPYVAMDTEFPGTVLKPVSVSRGDPSYNYMSLKSNVNTLKLIQLGLTFSDERGSLPECERESEEELDTDTGLFLLPKHEPSEENNSGSVSPPNCVNGQDDPVGYDLISSDKSEIRKILDEQGRNSGLEWCSRNYDASGEESEDLLIKCETRHKNVGKKKAKKCYCIWQFNFCEFSPLEDVCAHESIDLLRRAGIDFNKFKRYGISFARFGEVFMSSGVVLNPEVHWITFHCAYDIGYLLRVLTSKKLPELESDFMNVVRVFFPILYDIKYMMKFHALHGSLTNLAISLGVDRLGESHQAGSDSLLTSCVFREIKESYCNGSTEQYAGVLYGLGVDSLSY